ncbi:MAG: cytochrome c, partial [Pirellulales bacterium]|nr:cytochrome c [Pirellulales bacterium]
MNRDDQPTPWFRKIWPLSRRWRPRHAPRPLAPHRACRPLCFESCESRRLLNGTGVISGTVFADPAGSTPLENAVVQLFEDTNGDREFDAGDIAIASDVSAPGTGAYEFSALADGRYFVQQQPLAAPLAAVLPAHYTVDIMGGSAGSLIDDFDAPDPLATFFINGIDADPKAMPAIGPKIEGGQRDALIDVQGTPNAISATGFFGQGVFNLGSATPGTLAILEYDGPDADHTSPIVNGHGLDLDATNHGANSGISVYFNTIQVGGVATRMGLEATLTGPMGESAFYTGLVPESTGPSSFFIPFTAFAVSSGFSFENVDSLSFLFNPTTMLDVDFVVDRIALNDPSGVTYDFVNEVPGIDVEKSTNGQDADLPTGPLVAVGDGVT